MFKRFQLFKQFKALEKDSENCAIIDWHGLNGLNVLEVLSTAWLPYKRASSNSQSSPSRGKPWRIPEAPYPPADGYQMILQDMAATNPKAAQSNAKDFVELRYVKELEDSGFIKSLYRR